MWRALHFRLGHDVQLDNLAEPVHVMKTRVSFAYHTEAFGLVLAAFADRWSATGARGGVRGNDPMSPETAAGRAMTWVRP